MAAVKTLRDLRLERDKYVDPQEVLRLAKPLINSGSISKAGDDAWDIYEQTIFAALEVAEDTLALECLTRLTDKFPSSGRVHALRGMLLEATQDSSEAIKFYEKVLDMEPTNVPIIKRRITFNKSLGRVGEAIKYLVQYLDVYYTDADAWAELAELYTTISQFEKAAYCWSEVVLLQPHDHVSHASYADALYSQSAEQSDHSLVYAALKEYLRSVELCDDYLHGFCGIRTCCKAILAHPLPANAKESKALARKQTDDSSQLDQCRMPRTKVEALDAMSRKVLTRLNKDKDLTSIHGPGVKALLQTLIV